MPHIATPIPRITKQDNPVRRRGLGGLAED